MNYEQALKYIFSRRKFQKSSGNERITALMESLSNPQNSLKFVHVVGTNGKGTISTELSYMLKSAGYKVGLFTSPYVVEFGERIQVNNRYIEKNILSQIVTDIKEKVDILQEDGIFPTVFEITTAIAFVYFKMMNCDIVILEAGIGGEHDSTNIIPSPLALVITSISLDHTQMLGDTVEKITAEKCGAIKNGSYVISYPDNCKVGLSFASQKKNVIEIIKKKAFEKNCAMIIPDSNKVELLSETINGSIFTYDKLKINLPLIGCHQIANTITAIETAKVLNNCGFSLCDDDIISGIKESHIPARMEVIGENPMVILDGGHNEGCMKALADVIEKYSKKKNVVMLMSFMKDKDYVKSIEAIAPFCDIMIFTRTDTLRGEKVEALKKCALHLCDRVYADENPQEAYLYARELAKKDSILIVAGSFYLAGEIRNNFYC